MFSNGTTVGLTTHKLIKLFRPEPIYREGVNNITFPTLPMVLEHTSLTNGCSGIAAPRAWKSSSVYVKILLYL